MPTLEYYLLYHRVREKTFLYTQPEFPWTWPGLGNVVLHGSTSCKTSGCYLDVTKWVLVFSSQILTSFCAKRFDVNVVSRNWTDHVLTYNVDTASLLNSYPLNGIFNAHLTTIKDSYTVTWNGDTKSIQTDHYQKHRLRTVSRKKNFKEVTMFCFVLIFTLCSDTSFNKTQVIMK